MGRVLITGGSRSGKSGHAERLAASLSKEVVYIATASVGPGDRGEMAQRIAAHRRSRPQHWLTIEEPVAAGRTIREHSAPGDCVVLDCVTLWLSNVLGLHEPSEDPLLLRRERLESERHDLLAAVEQYRGHLIIVTNELGSGVVPMGELSRFFVDEHGWTNQRLAEACDSVVLMVAGVPVTVKAPKVPLQLESPPAAAQGLRPPRET